MEIKLNDILRLTDEEIARTKVRFNADYGGEDAIDIYKRDPERVNSSGFLWRGKQQMFSVGQIGVCLLLVRRDLWLLTTVKTITRELGVTHGVNYEAEEVARLKPYFNRVFVRWHRTRKQQNQCVWFGKLMDEFVVHSIESCEYDGDEFPGYDKVRLSYGQLEAVIVRHRTDWVNALAGQKAVYLITDTKTGKMYVGSATSDRGMLLARWTAYIENGHGGDARLKTLVQKKGMGYVRRNYTFSILENYNARVSDSEVLNRESWWKGTLQTRRFGYNGN